MVHQERLEIGEKCFVSAIMALLAIEASLTVIICGMHFSWIGLLLGVVGFCLMMFLANRLYGGSRSAEKIALGWVGFQVLFAGFALYLMASSPRGVETARQIGAPAAWTVMLKVIAYVYLGWVLVRMPTVRDFFAGKRGEIKTHEVVAATPTPDAVPLELSADQNQAVRGLAQYLRYVVPALIGLGVLQVLASVVTFGLSRAQPQGLLMLVQGLLTMVLGMALGGPCNDVRPLSVPEEQSRGQLHAALASLAKYYKVQVVIGILLALVAVARIAAVLL